MTIYAPLRLIVLGTVGGQQLVTSNPVIDPSSVGLVAPLNSVYFGTSLYIKTGSGNTAWTSLATASSVATLGAGIYGSGRDGSVVATTSSLARVPNYTDLQVPNGVVLNPDRWLIVCSGTLTIDAGGVIRQNGTNGVGNAAGTGGGAGGSGVLGVGTSGGAGGNNTLGSAGSAASNQPVDIGTSCKGGNGGASSAAGAGAAGGAVTAAAASSGSTYLASPLLGFFQYGNTAVNGGSGGGGGSATGSSVAGGGGGGGGVIVIIAKAIVNNGTLEARGGNGGNAVSSGGGGGGGGGGGKIFLITRSYTGTAPGVAGGSGGTGLGGGVTGSDGSAGLLIQLSM